MKNREAFSLNSYMLAYNLFLVWLHVVLFLLGFWATDGLQTCWKCAKIDLTSEKITLKEKTITLIGYIYFLSKFLEMLDTVFFILR